MEEQIPEQEKMQQASQKLQSLYDKELQQNKVEEKSCADNEKLRQEREYIDRQMAENNEGIEKVKRGQEEYQEDLILVANDGARQ